MNTLGKIQDGKEEELTVPEALINDKRKGKMWLFYLCAKLTCVCFCYVVIILLYIFNAILMLLIFLFRNFYASTHK